MSRTVNNALAAIGIRPFRLLEFVFFAAFCVGVLWSGNNIVMRSRSYYKATSPYLGSVTGRIVNARYGSTSTTYNSDGRMISSRSQTSVNVEYSVDGQRYVLDGTVNRFIDVNASRHGLENAEQIMGTPGYSLNERVFFNPHNPKEAWLQFGLHRYGMSAAEQYTHPIIGMIACAVLVALRFGHLLF